MLTKNLLTAITQRLNKRWDNAAQHSEILTYPHHVHDTTEKNVLPHEAMNVEKVLSFISTKITI